MDSSGPFTLIMYTNPIRQQDLATIETYASQRQTPVVCIHSAGFYSYFRFILHGTFPIVDTHPEVERTTDLRLLRPWPELVAFAKGMVEGIDTLDDHEHGHLPYLVILLHFLERWRLSHDGKDPMAYREKKEFEKLVSAGARTNNSEGGEENFQEAVAAINKNIKAPGLEPGLEEVFNHRFSSEVSSVLHHNLRRKKAQRDRSNKTHHSGSLRGLSASFTKSMAASHCPGRYQI